MELRSMDNLFLVTHVHFECSVCGYLSPPTEKLCFIVVCLSMYKWNRFSCTFQNLFITALRPIVSNGFCSYLVRPLIYGVSVMGSRALWSLLNTYWLVFGGCSCSTTTISFGTQVWYCYWPQLKHDSIDLFYGYLCWFYGILWHFVIFTITDSINVNLTNLLLGLDRPRVSVLSFFFFFFFFYSLASLARMFQAPQTTRGCKLRSRGASCLQMFPCLTHESVMLVSGHWPMKHTTANLSSVGLCVCEIFSRYWDHNKMVFVLRTTFCNVFHWKKNIFRYEHY